MWNKDLPVIGSQSSPRTADLNNDGTVNVNDLLTVINNWEKATGHKIKNPEANVMGSVKLQPASSSNGNAVKQKVALN